MEENVCYVGLDEKDRQSSVTLPPTSLSGEVQFTESQLQVKYTYKSYFNMTCQLNMNSDLFPCVLFLFFSEISVIMKPVFTREIKISLLYDYWHAYLTTVDGGEIPCLAKKLSGIAIKNCISFLAMLLYLKTLSF